MGLPLRPKFSMQVWFKFWLPCVYPPASLLADLIFRISPSKGLKVLVLVLLQTPPNSAWRDLGSHLLSGLKRPTNYGLCRSMFRLHFKLLLPAPMALQKTTRTTTYSWPGFGPRWDPIQGPNRIRLGPGLAPVLGPAGLKLEPFSAEF